MAEITRETPLSDRDLVVHAVQHLEAIHDRIEDIWAALEPLLPLAARLAGNGRMPNAIDLMQARREMRRHG